MARKLRFEYEGSIHHVYARGNERREIFRCDDDRRTFLNLLAVTAKKFDWYCWGYCLMDNHYHLFIKNVRKKLSKGMHWLNGMYSQKFNKKYERSGHLFQGRFQDTLVQSGAHASVLSRYIVLNPVRAEMVGSPGDWPWSSYAATIGQAAPHGCLNIAGTLQEFGGITAAGRQNYAEFVLGGIGQKPDEVYVPIFGDKEFIKEQVGTVSDKSLLKLVRPSLGEIIVLAESRSPNEIALRNASIVEAVQDFGYSRKEVADCLNMTSSYVSKMLKNT